MKGNTNGHDIFLWILDAWYFYLFPPILLWCGNYKINLLSRDRQHGGVQIRWNQSDGLSFGQKWNPWCSDIPWITLAHHPIIYNPKENETATFNVDEFFESLLQATSKVYEVRRPNEKASPTCTYFPILILCLFVYPHTMHFHAKN